MREILMITLLIGSVSSARSEWQVVTEDDAFNGPKHIALVMSETGYGVGFRCTKADDLTLIFLTPEKAGDDAKALSRIPVRLLAITDSEPKIDVAATTDVAIADGTYLFFSDAEGVQPLMKQVASARKRLAIAIELGGKAYHSTNFDVRGATKKLLQLAASCHLP